MRTSTITVYLKSGRKVTAEVFTKETLTAIDRVNFDSGSFTIESNLTFCINKSEIEYISVETPPTQQNSSEEE